MKDLLATKREKKAKQPKFIKQDAHKKPKLGTSWRKPRGIQSKMRLQVAGHRPIVKSGYMSPKALKGVGRSGLLSIKVNTVSDLENIDLKTQGIIIASAVGKKKKCDIIKVALEKKITILNLKEPEKYVQDIEKALELNKKEKTQKIQSREKKQKELEKKAEEKKKKEAEAEKAEVDVETELEKKKEEKKEMDKVLTQKDK